MGHTLHFVCQNSSYALPLCHLLSKRLNFKVVKKKAAVNCFELFRSMKGSLFREY